MTNEESQVSEQPENGSDNGQVDIDEQAAGPPEPSDIERKQLMVTAAIKLLDTLAPPEEGALWFILDTARSPVTLSGLFQHDPPRSNLFENTSLAPMIHVAPYLIRLEQGSTFLTWLLAEGMGQSWGIFLTSSAGQNELTDHFRKLTTALDDNGREMYFRFYDPRVLHVFLANTTMEEADHFFSEQTKIIVETDLGEAWISYYTDDEGLKKSINLLSTAEQSPEPVIVEKRTKGETDLLLSENGFMIMRPEMMTALTRYARTGFMDRLTTHVGDAYPEIIISIPPADLRPRLEATADRAVSYGILTESDISSFVDLTFELGEHFDSSEEYVWATEILKEVDHSPSTRLQKIWHNINGVDFIREEKQGGSFFEPDDGETSN